MGHVMIDISSLDPAKPVLIFGPTASGKSALAMDIARAQDRMIVNADALQVYESWPILTAQPSAADRAEIPHHLYGQLAAHAPYSVGDWLRDVTPYLDRRPVIVGGTGLYFTALTEGLADIPPTPEAIRAEADGIPLPDLIAALDTATRRGLDLANRARVQRAWEVQAATGRSIRDWQADTPPPLLPLAQCEALVLFPEVAWLTRRIEARFDLMLNAGALAEAEAVAPSWDPAAPSSKAIGAQEMIALLRGEITLENASEAVIVASRQYAKRQRTWARSRMKGWRKIKLPDLEASDKAL